MTDLIDHDRGFVSIGAISATLLARYAGHFAEGPDVQDMPTHRRASLAGVIPARASRSGRVTEAVVAGNVDA